MCSGNHFVHFELIGILSEDLFPCLMRLSWHLEFVSGVCISILYLRVYDKCCAIHITYEMSDHAK